MGIFSKLFGRMIYGLAKALDFVMDGFISLIETGVLVAKSFLAGCVMLISMGGCLFLLLLIGPLGTLLVRHPEWLLIFMLIVFFPILGALFNAYLTYLKFITTGYLYNLAYTCMGEPNYRYRTMDDFRKEYRRAEEERIRREQQRRYEQQRQWEERFRQWHRQEYRQGPSAANPYEEFQKEYEKSCDILGVPYNADQNRIKLAYRRKAKEHHPDVNKDPAATRKFQQINDAYEFLTEENIRRYRQIKGQYKGQQRRQH